MRSSLSRRGHRPEGCTAGKQEKPRIEHQKGGGVKRPKLRILGVMTGTSCDGLDAILMEFDLDSSFRARWSASLPYPFALRRRVLEIQKPGTRCSLRELLSLNADLGEWFGSSLARLIRRHPGSAPHVIANHGQTVAHFPGKRGATLQLGDPTRIAQATGLTVVANFRDGDMAAGGQGAPLVPRFHEILAKSLGSSRRGIAIHNIGGISNLTYVGARATLAFDTGPGNIWIDAAAAIATKGHQLIDRGGKLAAAGQCEEDSLQKILTHPFFKKTPPKSTGRDDFPISLLTSASGSKGPDLVATATAATVESIGRAYERFVLSRDFPLEKIYLCGGGARNPVLVRGIETRMERHGVQVLPLRSPDPRFIEAQAFAYFGLLALQGQPLGGEWTGAKAFGAPAHLVPGKNWARVLELIPKATRR